MLSEKLKNLVVELQTSNRTHVLLEVGDFFEMAQALMRADEVKMMGGGTPDSNSNFVVGYNEAIKDIRKALEGKKE